MFVQRDHQWSDGSVYAISNWDAYPLKTYKHVIEVNETYKIAIDAISAIHDLMHGDFIPSQTSSNCTGLWYKSPVIEYTPWVTIPCNHQYYSYHLICEHDMTPVEIKEEESAALGYSPDSPDELPTENEYLSKREARYN